MSETPNLNFWSRPKTIAKAVVGLALGLGVALLFRPNDAGRASEGALYPGAPARFGVGTAPNPGTLAAWDSDIGPDGAELPAGQGTVAEGRRLYAAQCASCHGANGEGIAPIPQLVGRPAAAESFGFGDDGSLPKTIGNYWPHATTLFDYIRRAMPLATPGALSDNEVYALTAYLLAANAVIGDTVTLDAASLRAVRMPARDRFVPDDRAGQRTVR
jgi:mono/diheme cytochrome c family protein